MSPSIRQLPLKFHPQPQYTFEGFNPAGNQAAVGAIQELCRLDQEMPASPAPVFLWGETYCGKSHLLHAGCQQISQSGGHAAVIPAEMLLDTPSFALIDAFDVICLDDIHRLAGQARAEEHLFAWVNQLRRANKPFAMASQIAPGDPHWQLPDLVSRLHWGKAWQLFPLHREEALSVFYARAAERGIKLDETVLNWLRRNQSNDLKFFLQLLDLIDELTMETRRKITIPLLKQIIGKMLH